MFILPFTLKTNKKKFPKLIFREITVTKGKTCAPERPNLENEHSKICLFITGKIIVGGAFGYTYPLEYGPVE